MSVNSYLIQDIAKAGLPLSPAIESGIWYQYYFQTERGRAGLTANRHEIARTLWIRNSPTWRFDEATLDRHASAFNNPDYVEVVIHSYRHRLGLAAGYPMYEELEQRAAAQPTITVPTITLDGDADGVVPATDGKSTAAKFTGASIGLFQTLVTTCPKKIPKHSQLRSGNLQQRKVDGFSRAMTLYLFPYSKELSYTPLSGT